MIIALAWISAALAGIAALFAVVNRLTWPRGTAGVRFGGGGVSVLVPARNEAKNLGACLSTVAKSGHPISEIIVYDDASTDDTHKVLEALSKRIPHLRVERGGGLPPGWVGKVHACHRLAAASKGELLVFLDADVRLTPTGIERIASLHEKLNADIVTAVPAQRMETFAERLVLPLLHLTYVSWFPLVLVYRSRDPRFLAANGQVLAVTRSAYARTGGFAAIRAEIVDDMAFCRRAKAEGLRVVFADGHLVAACRMYDSARAVVAGFSKNLYEGLGERPWSLMAVLGLYLGAFVGPYVALFAGWFAQNDALFTAGAVGTASNLVIRAVLAVRHAQPLSGILLHPISVLAFVGIALNSAYWSWRGDLRWRGRAYPRRSERRLASPPGGFRE